MAAWLPRFPWQYPHPIGALPVRRCSRLVAGLGQNPHESDPIDLARSDDHLFAPLALDGRSPGVFDVHLLHVETSFRNASIGSSIS